MFRFDIVPSQLITSFSLDTGIPTSLLGKHSSIGRPLARRYEPGTLTSSCRPLHRHVVHYAPLSDDWITGVGCERTTAAGLFGSEGLQLHSQGGRSIICIMAKASVLAVARRRGNRTGEGRLSALHFSY